MIDMEKLRKLLLVMLSTDQAGEVAAASAAVTKTLRKGGKDVHWLVDRLVSDADPLSQTPWRAPWNHPPPTPQWGMQHWNDDLAYCAERPSQLRPRERIFIDSLISQKASGRAWWQPSAMQRKWLEDIATRLKDHAAT